MKKRSLVYSFILIFSLATASIHAMHYDYSCVEDYTQESHNLDENSKKLFNLYVTLNLIKHAQTSGNMLILPGNWQSLETTDLEALHKELLLKHILPLSQEIQKDCYKTSFSIPRQATTRSKQIITQNTEAP